jgi:hypothetical protein
MTPREEYALKRGLMEQSGASLDPSDVRFRHPLMPVDVLWTVPHGAPGNDAVAPESGLSADEHARRLGLKSLILMSVVDRYEFVDMNRPESRSTNFRKAVRETITLRRPRFVIDVHSFPDRYDRYSGRDIVVIHTPGVTDEAFARQYATLLRLAGLKLGKPIVVEAQTQHQPVQHDIINECCELDVDKKAFALVECNESGDAALYGLVNAMAVKALIG